MGIKLLEREFLKAGLNEPEAFELITPHVFTAKFSRRIFQAGAQLRNKDKPVSVLTLSIQSGISREKIKRYLDVEPDHAVYEYAETLKEQADKRNVAGKLREYAKKAQNGKSLQSLFTDIIGMEEFKGKSETQQIGVLYDAISGSVLDKKDFADFDTHIEKLNNVIFGFSRKDMLTIAGEPGAGKTALAFNLIQYLAERGEKCMMFQYEMSQQQMAIRLASSVLQLDSRKIRAGKLNRKEREMFENYKQYFVNVPIFIQDVPPRTEDGIMKEVYQQKMNEGLDVLVIDNAQITNLRGYSQTIEKIKAISNLTKEMAKKYDIATILISHVTKQVASRKSDLLKLTDLRYGRVLEQDSDVIFMIQQYDMHTGDELTNKRVIDVQKNRMGERGWVEVPWDAKTTTFGEV